MAGRKVDPYPFDQRFEHVVMALLASTPRFWRLVGSELDEAAMPSDASKLVLRAVKAIEKDTKVLPDSPTIVVQRLNRWRHEGKVTQEQIFEIDDAINAVMDAGLPATEAVVGELAPIISRRLQHEAVMTATTEYAGHGDFHKVEQLIDRAKRIGVNDVSMGAELGKDSFNVIAALRQLDRLPYGIMELDTFMSGGCPRGQLTVFVGGSGDGKSMALSHQVANASMHGCFVAVPTLELPEAIVLARIKANMTDVPIDEIMTDSTRCQERMQGMTFGPVVVKYFTPNSTTVADIKAWVAQVEEEHGRTIDLLAVDYADKLSGGKRDDDKGTYHGMRAVYEDLRIYVHERKIWGSTASASTGRGDAKKAQKLDLEHMADSAHKGRIADIVLTLNFNPETAEMEIYVAKNRTGKSRQKIGPLPTDFACGRISPSAFGDFGSAGIAHGPLKETLKARAVVGALMEQDELFK